MLIVRWNEASRALPVLTLKSNYLDRAQLLMAIEKDQMQTTVVIEAGEVLQELRKQICETDGTSCSSGHVEK